MARGRLVTICYPAPPTAGLDSLAQPAEWRWAFWLFRVSRCLWSGRPKPTRAFQRARCGSLSYLVCVLSVLISHDSLAETFVSGEGVQGHAWVNDPTSPKSSVANQTGSDTSEQRSAVPSAPTTQLNTDSDVDQFSLHVGFGRTQKNATITRETHCFDAPLCPDDDANPSGRLVHVKEFQYERRRYTVETTARLLITKALSFSLHLPFVLSDRQTLLLFADGEIETSTEFPAERSTIAPRQGAQLVPVPADSDSVAMLPERRGMGDPRGVIRYTPPAQYDRGGDVWSFELSYTAPTAPAMKRGGTSVGRGLHQWGGAVEVRSEKTRVAPFFRVAYTHSVSASGSLFQDYGAEREYIGPGDQYQFRVGGYLLPYIVIAPGLALDGALRVGSVFQEEGRDYHELFDALALGAQDFAGGGRALDAHGRINHAYFTPYSVSTEAGKGIDGITTVEPFLTLDTQLTFRLYLGERWTFVTECRLARVTAHLISSAEVGRDRSGEGLVDRADEFNPTFSPGIDAHGRRLRVEDVMIFGFGARLAHKF